MPLVELNKVAGVLEGYCYFNDVLSKCDSAYSIELLNGCKSRLYVDIIKDDVLKVYKDKFDNALSLLCKDTPNPLETNETPMSLSEYLSMNGKVASVEDLAVRVDGVSKDTKSFMTQYNDIFSISKSNNELIYESDGDSDEDFDYSDDVVEEDSVDDSDVFYDFSDSTDGDSDEDYDYSDEEYADDGYESDYSDDDEEFDYSEEVTESLEELPLDEDSDSVFFDFNNKDDIADSDSELSSSEEDEFDYSEDEEFDYSDEEEFDYSDEEYSEDDEEFDYSDDSLSSDEEFDYSEDEYLEDDEEFDYSDDSITDTDDEFDYSEEESYDEEFSYEDEEEFSYDESEDVDDSEDDFSYDEDDGFDNDAPVFSTISPNPVVQRKKEDYEISAERVQGIVEGGTRFLKGVGSKIRDSLLPK